MKAKIKKWCEVYNDDYTKNFSKDEQNNDGLKDGEKHYLQEKKKKQEKNVKRNKG